MVRRPLHDRLPLFKNKILGFFDMRLPDCQGRPSVFEFALLHEDLDFGSHLQ